MINFFSRLNENKTGTALPKSWLENISMLIAETYPELSKHHQNCSVWSELYDTELLLIISLINEKTSATAITVMLSADITKNSDKELKRIMDKSVETAGLIIEGYLADLESSDVSVESIPEWTEEKKNKFSFYYKITRENIDLTLEANKLLDK